MLSAELEGGVIVSPGRHPHHRPLQRPAATASAASPATASGRATSAAAATRRPATVPAGGPEGRRRARRQLLRRAAARRELPARPARGVRRLRRPLRRRRLALGPRRHRRQHGRGRRRLPPALVGRRQPVRRHALRAAALQLRGADPEARTTTSSSGSASPSRPGSDRWRAGGSAPRWRRSWRLPARLAAAAGGAPGPGARSRPRLRGRGLPLHQPGAHPDRLEGRPAAPGRRGPPARRRCAAEARALDQLLREGGERADRPAARRWRPRSSASSATPSTPGWCRRGATRTAAPTTLAQEFDQRRRQFYAQVAPILVMLMDRYGAKAIFDENSVLLADQSLNITDAVIAEIDARTPAADAGPAGAGPGGRRPPPAPPAAGIGRRRLRMALAIDAALPQADIATIKRMIPHRYPFLMIDRVVNIERQPLRRRHQERHRQRAAFRGPLPGAAGDAGRADHRGDGADLGGAGGRRPST